MSAGQADTTAATTVTTVTATARQPSEGDSTVHANANLWCAAKALVVVDPIAHGLGKGAVGTRRTACAACEAVWTEAVVSGAHRDKPKRQEQRPNGNQNEQSPPLPPPKKKPQQQPNRQPSKKLENREEGKRKENHEARVKEYTRVLWANAAGEIVGRGALGRNLRASRASGCMAGNARRGWVQVVVCEAILTRPATARRSCTAWNVCACTTLCARQPVPDRASWAREALQQTAPRRRRAGIVVAGAARDAPCRPTQAPDNHLAKQTVGVWCEHSHTHTHP